nr:hypothetical protein [Marinicella sp. W31]MDC2876966.1 hypothetical protein [Marinicella sp. W31]
MTGKAPPDGGILYDENDGDLPDVTEAMAAIDPSQIAWNDAAAEKHAQKGRP